MDSPFKNIVFPQTDMRRRREVLDGRGGWEGETPLPLPVLCTVDDVSQWLLADYITAAVELNATIVEDTIAAASGEIIELVAYQVRDKIPTLLRNIAAVFAAYRIMEAITGIVSTESSAGNVWLPLQKEYRRMDALLQDIAKGTIKLGLAADSQGAADASVAVLTKPQELDLAKF